MHPEGPGEQKPFGKELFEWDPEGGGHLLGSRCEHCGIAFFPPRSVCSVCFRQDGVRPVELSKKGILYTHSTVYQSQTGFATPYTIGYVDLPEGVRVFARIVDGNPDDLRTGMAMGLTFGSLHEPAGEGGPVVYKFRPVRE